MRRTKPSLLYRRTKHLRVVQLFLGYTKLDYLPRGTMSGVLLNGLIVASQLGPWPPLFVGGQEAFR
jgi:hypothetical protein